MAVERLGSALALGPPQARALLPLAAIMQVLFTVNLTQPNLTAVITGHPVRSGPGAADAKYTTSCGKEHKFRLN